MKINQIDFVVFDVETTGLSPLGGDRIVEIAGVKLRNDEITGTFESLINPVRDIPEEARRIHNITPEMVKDSPSSSDVLPQMMEFIGGACLVGHNIKFDLDFLCYELSLCGRKLHAATPAVDTLKMTKAFLPHLSRHRLENVAQYFGATVGETHRALADVKLTANIFSRLVDNAHKQGIRTLGDLIKQFGVEKPNFRMEQVIQGTLF